LHRDCCTKAFWPNGEGENPCRDHAEREDIFKPAMHYVAVDKLPIITLTGLVANPAKYADGR